jgi:hypothetical protein
MFVRGLALARGDMTHDGVLDGTVRPREQVRQAGLLCGLAQRDPQRVALSRVPVAARLQPHPQPLVPAEQHPATIGMDHQGRGGEMQRQRPRPRIRLGRGQPAHPRHVGGLAVPARLVPGEPPADHRSMVPRKHENDNPNALPTSLAHMF